MKKLLTLVLVIFVITGFASAQQIDRLFRFPAIHNDTIAFTYAGDLYLVTKKGGEARKITSGVGYEMFARFSPDGKTIAFTGQYDGNTEVYTMNSQGGIPKRITYTATLNRDDIADRMGPNNLVIGWKHDNKNIVFRSRKKSYNSFNGALYTVNVNGSMEKELPFLRGGFCSYSSDDKKLAFNRIFREFRTWKRYRGGMADDIWIFDFKTHKTINVTNNPAQDIIPMWHGDKIYFLSDRDENKRMNLYVYDTNSKETKRLSDYKDFDIKFPSLGDKAIVFENGGYIYKFYLATEKIQKVKIIIAEDFVSARPQLKDVSKEITNFEISPDGKRALFGAHGDVFTVPAKYGEIRNLTKTSSVHERNSKWSPDGKNIAFISDKTGENELFIIDQAGKNPPKQVTKGGDTYNYQEYWSPDSKKLLWADRKQRLRYVDIKSGIISEVDQCPYNEMHSYAWSPDSKWITYSKTGENQFSQIFVYSTEQKKSFTITDNRYNSGSPVFSADGKYLFFTSNRNFSPTFSWLELDAAYNYMTGIYYVTLNKSIPSLFAPKSDEVKIEDISINKTSEKKKDKKTVSSKISVKYDFDGILDRIEKLPVSASQYFNLTSVGKKIFYQRMGKKDEKVKFFVYDFTKRKQIDLGNINGYEISADGKKMLVSKDRAYAIISLPNSKITLKEKLNLSGMQVMVDKQKEWKQIYDEAWYQMREFFYAPNMHGTDWKALHDRYAQLVPYAKQRNDLTYVIGELIGELNVGHAYTGGGDRPKVSKIKTGLLGAVIEKDTESGFFKIKKILKGQNWTGNIVSPLTKIGVNAHEGDYILAIDGISTKTVQNIYKLLLNKAGKQVQIKLNDKASITGSRESTVVPIEDEASLYYLQWVENNIRKVNEATNGKVGYVHIPDMGVDGLNEFVKYYYPQLSKKALVIDVRGNGGGFVSPIIIERLRRVANQINIARNGQPSVNPGGSMNGPLVMLSDEFSASDGDIVTWRFKTSHLGKVVGKRTWGGVVGIRGSLPFVDGGSLNKPEFSRYDLEGKKWIMEGHGVDPDIYVDNDPYLEYIGTDQQLKKAIEVILEELKTKEKTLPEHPPYPKK